jgi:DNA-binding CsgD family transcriptional regulator
MDGSRAAAPSVPAPLNALRTLGLTPREAEVLFWVSEGKGNEVIGRLLGVSPRTIQKHLETVHRKLGVENRTAAAAVALRHLMGA